MSGVFFCPFRFELYSFFPNDTRGGCRDLTLSVDRSIIIVSVRKPSRMKGIQNGSYRLGRSR